MSIERNTLFTIIHLPEIRDASLMLDIVAAIYATAYVALQAGLIIGFARLRPELKIAAFAAAALWLVLVMAVYAWGGLRPGVLGPIPVNFLPFTIFLVILFGTWFRSSVARSALKS